VRSGLQVKADILYRETCLDPRLFRELSIPLWCGVEYFGPDTSPGNLENVGRGHPEIVPAVFRRLEQIPMLRDRESVVR
jgi:hypothetical protein